MNIKKAIGNDRNKRDIYRGEQLYARALHKRRTLF
jgi:hypothetical protein